MEAEFFVAAELGWRSVEAMRLGLSNDEFVRWCVYFGRRAQRQEIAWRTS